MVGVSRHRVWPLLVSLLGLVAALTQATSIAERATTFSPAWKMLYQNDANWARALSSTPQASYLLYTGNVTNSAIAATCSTANESPLTISGAIDAGLQKQLQYLIYDKTFYPSMSFWIQNTAAAGTTCSTLLVTSTSVTTSTMPCTSALPVLCTQSAPRTTFSAATNNAKYALQVNGLTAYRDAFSFRFVQIPYANTPQRFAQSTVYTLGSTSVIPGKSSTCPNKSNPSSEDCLVMNIYTPVIQSGPSNIVLKSIIVWLHGGGLTTGSGQDPSFDGGSMASRGDVIVITPNYRLGALGFLPINSAAKGNYAVGDVITLLRWIQANAVTFGGDKNRVTIAGQSAGAQIVATLLSTPSATGLYARAIMQSTRPADLANRKITNAQALANGGPAKNTINSVGCGSASDVLACLRGLSVSQILAGTPYARFTVDGSLITEPNIDVARLRNGYINKVQVMMGFMRDEAASLNYAPPTTTTSLDAALKAGNVASNIRTIVEGNKSLFPVASGATGIRDLTVAVETDTLSIARCGQESTMYSAALNSVFSSFYTFTSDQRSYQLQNYDPFGVCLSTTSATSGYYLCHSGDLYPTFNTAGYAANYPVRDSDDVVHTSLTMDLWTTFARSGSPNPSSGYLNARGYTSTASKMSSLGSWTTTTSASQKILSLGPSPVMKALNIRGPQCSAYGFPINYIAQGK
jgi:carboxylesterase type B